MWSTLVVSNHSPASSSPKPTRGMYAYDHCVPEDAERFVSLDQLPDDPLTMPPPYWRGAGAIFHLQRGVAEISKELLPELVSAWKAWTTVVNDVGINAITDDKEHLPEQAHALMYIESKIKHTADLAIFMAAIEAEDAINWFAVFNLHKDSVETIEKLSPPEKLILVTALVGAVPVKGKAVFESITRLTSRRNRAAHGHPVDRPSGSLRRSHLIDPEQLPTVPEKIEELKAYLRDYFRVREYLRGISKNSYTSEPLGNDQQIANSLTIINGYRFDVRGQSYYVYAPGT